MLAHFNFLHFFSNSSLEFYNGISRMNYKEIESNAKKGHMEGLCLLGFLAFFCLCVFVCYHTENVRFYELSG